MKSNIMSDATGNQNGAEPGPKIEALPEVPKTELLLGQLNQAKVELEKMGRQKEELRAHNTALQERVDFLEKNPLIFALGHMDGGEVLRAAGEDLSAVCRAVLEVGKKGMLQVALKVEANGRAVVLTPAVKVTVPRLEAAKSVFFQGDDGALVRNDPRQRELPLRGVVEV